MVENETDWVNWLRSMSTNLSGDVETGIGDDAAVLRCRGGTCVVTADSLIEGIHFEREGVRPEAIGHKAMARGLSDMAAMGVGASAALMSAFVPRGTDADFLQSIYRGARLLAESFGVDIVGGDTSAGRVPLAVSVCVLGWAREGRPVLRSGAQEGDAVMVTGELGGARKGKHISFVPRVREGVLLNERFDLHAMIDVSDGLAPDFRKMLSAGGRGGVLFESAIPVSQAAKECAAESGLAPVRHALCDGEDYELLFALSAPEAERLVAEQPLRCGVTLIGRIEGKEAALGRPDGRREPLTESGYVHGW